MIIVKQFVDGDQGRERTLGIIRAWPQKHNVFTKVMRGVCVSDLWERKTVYTFRVYDVEYVVDKNTDGDFELQLASDDRVPPAIKSYCVCCGRAK